MFTSVTAKRSFCIAIILISSFISAIASAQMTPKPDQKIALITGSTSGLGREVAFRLSALDYFIIVHGRNRERGLEVVAQIEESGIGGARFYAADLGSLQQVRQLGEDLVKDFDRLDVLVNNAGIGSSPARRLVSEDGHELRFQVNYLSHFLLTHQLLPLLQDSAPSRIVNVSSGAQQAIDFDDVMLESGFSGGRAYAQSKLAQILFTVDLAENLQGSDVLVNALHPATYMDTAMVRNAGATPRTTVGEGADGVMQLITEDVGSGNYFVRQRSVRANRQAYDEDARTRLWQLSEQLTGLE
mgnify:FL=1|jgi:NAD(P)-dependent dehydrogenase (short-subunit alcohol dehydrogenase family)|tara:strand:+ start:584 stop:1483 length:900 start_codon:yes stop_codon:yes gene_type:complete